MAVTHDAAMDRSGYTYRPAPFIRLFGWGTLAVMLAFLINNVLTYWFDWPGVGALAEGSISLLGIVQAAIYAGLVVLAVMHARNRGDAPLREDAATVTGWNTFFIRAAFWVVFLVGMVDMGISALRIENMLGELIGEELASDLGRSQYRGTYVHAPLIVLGILLACVTRTLGFIWLALLVVVAELAIVFTRFVFSYEQAYMGDLVRFWYAALFLFASAYTLIEDGHVRVDVFYAGFARRKKAFVNSVGSVFLGMTLCWTVLILGMSSKAAIINSPILAFEITQSTTGLFVKYFMAGFLAVFAISMMMQFVAMLFDSIADRREEPGGRELSGDIIH